MRTVKLAGCKKQSTMMPFTLYQCRGQFKALKPKYGKSLPEPVDPEERGPSSTSAATEDKKDML